MTQKKSVDVLQKKKQELNAYVARFNDAISLVTNTVNSLSDINAGIEEKIQEIDAYQAELANTKEGLDNARANNERVIKNFNALLGID